MARNGAVKFRDLPKRDSAAEQAYNEFNEFVALAINATKINCTDRAVKFGYQEEYLAKRNLILCNQVGYDKITNTWAKCYGYGFNKYWNAENIQFVLPSPYKSFMRPAYYEPDENGAYLLYGLPFNISFGQIIQWHTERMAAADKTIVQNLEAVKTPFICVVKDKDTRLSLQQAIQQRQQGEPVVIVDNNIVDGLKGVQTYTDFIVPQVFEYQTQIRDRLLNKLGTMSANINKRERVQVGEVNATVGQCEDFVYALIDNFNTQTAAYGLPFEMVLNTSLEELYAITTGTEESIKNEELSND